MNFMNSQKDPMNNFFEDNIQEVKVVNDEIVKEEVKNDDILEKEAKMDMIKKESREIAEISNEPREAERKLSRPVWLFGDSEGKGKVPVERVTCGGEGVGFEAIIDDIRLPKNPTTPSGKKAPEYWKVTVIGKGDVEIPHSSPGVQEKTEIAKFDTWVSEMQKAAALKKDPIPEDVAEFLKFNINTDDMLKLRKRDPIIKRSGDKIDLVTFNVLNKSIIKIGDRVQVAGCTYSIAYTTKDGSEKKNDKDVVFTRKPRNVGDPFISFSARIIHHGPVSYDKMNILLHDSKFSEEDLKNYGCEHEYPDDLKIKHGGPRAPNYLVSRMTNAQLLRLSHDALGVWVQIFNPYISQPSLPEEIKQKMFLGPTPITVSVPDTRPYKGGNDHHNYLCSKPKEVTTLMTCIRDESDSLQGGNLDETNPMSFNMPIYDLGGIFGITQQNWVSVGARLFRNLIALAFLFVRGYKNDVLDTMEGEQFRCKRFSVKPSLIVNMRETLMFSGVRVNKDIAYRFVLARNKDNDGEEEGGTKVKSDLFERNPVHLDYPDLKKAPFFCLNEYEGDLKAVFGDKHEYYLIPSDIKMLEYTMPKSIELFKEDFYKINKEGNGDKFVEEKWNGKSIPGEIIVMAVNMNI